MPFTKLLIQNEMLTSLSSIGTLLPKSFFCMITVIPQAPLYYCKFKYKLDYLPFYSLSSQIYGESGDPQISQKQ